MAEISLRAYVKELDDLIEHEQLDEAIAHCRHILQTYPKHLDVYRLLGKSYLEAKRYGDAADIFQRVLSAMPDDFVAHIGMAIVREDEGNLDAAIWHMERAFETNPSNQAIQQELRRLIGRRDGLEPHKVRLTRGALARMYAHGELYPQAIAELRSALQEDPDRPDLQVLLAEMYWRTNQRTEAAEVGQRILESLPFCREANRIMAAALQSGGQAEEAVTYHRRLASLDPYSALVESAMDDASRVEANAVRIDKLAWVPGQPVPGGDGGQPDWAASLGVDVRAVSPRPAAAKRPSWLESLESETAAARKIESAPPQAPSAEPLPPAYQPPTPDAPALPGEAAEAVREIPDWMRSAGWSEGKGQAVEAPVSFSDSELASLEAGTLPPEEGELAPADIPDWLKDIAPAEGLPVPEPSAEATPPAEEAGWLGAGASVSSDEEAPRLPPGWATPAPAPAARAQESEIPAEERGAPPSSVPTWMEEESPGATSTIVTWLGDRSKEALGRGRRADTPAPEQAPEAGPEAEPDFFKESLPEGVPDWLTEEVAWESPSAPEPAESKETDPGRPAWLTGVAAAAAEGESLRPEELSWPAAEPGLLSPAGMYADDAAEPSQPAAEIPDWIKAIADSDFAAEAPASTEAETSTASDTPESPDWLRQGQELPASGQVPDWGSDSGEEETDSSEARLRRASVDDESTADAPKESLAWLRELAESEPASPAASGEGSEERTSPSWLRGTNEDRPLRDALGRSSAPEWLRGIAEPEPEPSRQLSDEGTLDWMRGIAEGDAEEPSPPIAPAAPSPTEPARSAIEPESNLEWVSTGGVEGSPAATTTGEWLRRLKEEGTDAEIVPLPPTQQAAPAVPAAEDALDDEQVFQWLEGLAARQGADQPQPKTPEGLFSEEPVVARPSATGPAGNLPEEPAQGLEWLEQLAAERGPETQASKAPPSSPVSAAPKPVSPPASPEVPDWLRELVAEAGQPDPSPSTATLPPPATPEPGPSTEETLPALPDWMLTSSEETEPVFPLPPVPQSPKEAEALEIPSARKSPRTEAPTPIEELSEGWVPPWESLELEDHEEPARPAEPALPSIGPTDETLYVPSRRASEDETFFRRPLPAPEPAPTASRPISVEPPPAPALPPAAPSRAASGVEDEIPDWLQTPMPYVPPRTRPPVPAQAFREPQPAEEIEPVSPVAPAPSGLPPVVSEPAPRPITPAGTAWSPTEPPVAQPPAAPIPTPASAAPLEAPVIPEAPPLPPMPAYEPKPMMEPAPASAPLRSAERRVEPIPPAIAPAIPVAKPPARAPRTGRTVADPSQLLDAARKALATGDYQKAATSYGTLIKRNIEVQAITDELRLALDRNPKTPSLWQTLGDAYMKRERLQDAIEAYRRGMETA
jgi:tetratricopeptide (TPR) repeat protein